MAPFLLVRSTCTTIAQLRATAPSARAVPAHVPSLDGYPSLSHLAVALRQLASTRLSLFPAYVPGHQGDVGNELSDALAKQARLRPTSTADILLPTWQLAQHPLLPWAWLASQPTMDLPTLFAMESEAARLQGRPTVSRPPPCIGLHAPTVPASLLVALRVKAVSYNVLTLLDKPSWPRSAG